MAATGLEKGGLYRHFGSKEELAAEAFRYSLARVTEAGWAGIEEVEGSVEKLRFLVRRFVDIQVDLSRWMPGDEYSHRCRRWESGASEAGEAPHGEPAAWGPLSSPPVG